MWLFAAIIGWCVFVFIVIRFVLVLLRIIIVLQVLRQYSSVCLTRAGCSGDFGWYWLVWLHQNKLCQGLVGTQVESFPWWAVAGWQGWFPVFRAGWYFSSSAEISLGPVLTISRENIFGAILFNIHILTILQIPITPGMHFIWVRKRLNLKF